VYSRHRFDPLALNIKAPLLIVLGLTLLGWAYFKPRVWRTAASPFRVRGRRSKEGQFWHTFALD